MSFPAFLSTFYWCIIHLSFHSTPLNLYQDCSLTIYVIEGVSVRGNVVLVIPGLNVCRSNTLLHLGLIRAKMNRPISQRDFEIHHSREFLCFLLHLLFGPNKSQMIKKTRKKNAVWPYGPYRYKTDEEWAEMLRHRVPKRLHWARHFRPYLMKKSITKGNMNVSRKISSQSIHCCFLYLDQNQQKYCRNKLLDTLGHQEFLLSNETLSLNTSQFVDKWRCGLSKLNAS